MLTRKLSHIAAIAAVAGLVACGGDSGSQSTDTATADTLGSDVVEGDTAVADTLTPDTLTPDTLTPDTVEPDTCAGLTTCDDGDPCTEDTVVSGTAAACDLVCDHRDISGDPDEPDDDFVDSNCDGVDGVAAELVFVAPDGVDGAECGTMAAPCKSIDLALDLAAAQEKDVALATGDFAQPVTLHDGVSIYGGYDQADGWARGEDPVTAVSGSVVVGAGNQLMAVVVDGADLTEPTVIDRLLVDLSEAPSDAAGLSLVGIRLDDAPGVVLRHVDVVTARGNGGAQGDNGPAGREGTFGISATNRAGAVGVEQICEAGPNAPAGARGGNGGFDNSRATAGTGSGSAPQAGDGVPGCGIGGGSAGSNWDNWPIDDTDGTPGGTGGSCSRFVARGDGAPIRVSAFAGLVDGAAIWASGHGEAGAVGVNGFPGAGGGGGGSGDADTIPGGGDGGGGGSGSGGG
ncbi:MAG: hypothetical protein KC635_20795, partial [Myxococcales bacterium]|nr:hypothetical protein [Myxococcales bacterium]